ncbi:hypothetical protein BS47DRAFT_991289 [Hydnum rufescens UP504]|uniref:Uncharacterized protein n=1 Tax=Hydnum rufescens UP504 TaxID=1448309 RepID=A0A9P6AWB8_9AGAM|nr:hypothetical protein BS47DRAFT_991289 [Hydnum rufescens UP504]
MTALARLRPTLTVKETSPRAVSLLPEVKCTSCGSPVPLDELGDHECSPARKLPAPSPPSPSPSRVSRPIQPLNNVPQTTLSTAPTRTPSPRTPSPSPSRSASSPRSNTPSVPRTPPPQLQSFRTATSDQPSRTTSNPDRPSNPSLSPYGTVKSTRSLSTAPQILTNASADVPNTSPRSAVTPESVIPQPDSLEVPKVSFYAPDTKSGGQAGMAGVGRRAFAAVAHAALLSSSTSFANHSVGNDSTALPISRSQTPQYLEVNSIGGRSTPSLSSPRSSPSPRIPESSRTPSPGPPVRSPTTSPFRHHHDSVNIKECPNTKGVR